MRTIALSGLIIASSFCTTAFAQDMSKLNYNLVHLQAEASRDISNDQMQIVMYIEKNNKQPAKLATEINTLMNQALQTARQFPSVKVETGSQSTSPIYDADNRKLKEWRGRAQINLSSTDIKAASQLMADLQQNFQTQSVQFSVSEAKRQKIENELMIEASKNFQQRAKMISQAWNKSNYDLVSLNMNGNTYNTQPMPRVAMMKAAMADAVPEQEMAAGESKMTVTANGSIQLK